MTPREIYDALRQPGLTRFPTLSPHDLKELAAWCMYAHDDVEGAPALVMTRAFRGTKFRECRHCGCTPAAFYRYQNDHPRHRVEFNCACYLFDQEKAVIVTKDFGLVGLVEQAIAVWNSKMGVRERSLLYKQALF